MDESIIGFTFNALYMRDADGIEGYIELIFANEKDLSNYVFLMGSN